MVVIQEALDRQVQAMSEKLQASGEYVREIGKQVGDVGNQWGVSAPLKADSAIQLVSIPYTFLVTSCQVLCVGQRCCNLQTIQAIFV